MTAPTPNTRPMVQRAFMALMRSAAEVQPHEVKAVWVSFFFVFTLMAAYYILRPLRDALSSDWSDTELSTLFTATFISV